MALAPHRGCRTACLQLRLVLGAAVLAAACTVQISSAAAASPTAAAAHPYAGPVAEASERFGIPELWIWRVMHVESRGNRRAVSRAGAMGLMQVMPATWAMLTARHRLGDDPFDVRANIFAGAAYLRMMWDRYRDVSLMLAAYNAGPGRADAYAAGRRSLPAETIAYVRQIAPEIGASDGASPAPAPALAAPNWRDASVFAMRSGDANAVRSAAIAPSELPPAAAPSTNPGAPSPARGLLFVPLSGPSL